MAFSKKGRIICGRLLLLVKRTYVMYSGKFCNLFRCLHYTRYNHVNELSIRSIGLGSHLYVKVPRSGEGKGGGGVVPLDFHTWCSKCWLFTQPALFLRKNSNSR